MEIKLKKEKKIGTTFEVYKNEISKLLKFKKLVVYMTNLYSFKSIYSLIYIYRSIYTDSFRLATSLIVNCFDEKQMCSADRKNRFLLQVSSYIYTHVRITRRHLSYLLFIYLFIYMCVFILYISMLGLNKRHKYRYERYRSKNKRVARKIKE